MYPTTYLYLKLRKYFNFFCYFTFENLYIVPCTYTLENILTFCYFNFENLYIVPCTYTIDLENISNLKSIYHTMYLYLKITLYLIFLIF